LSFILNDNQDASLTFTLLQSPHKSQLSPIYIPIQTSTSSLQKTLFNALFVQQKRWTSPTLEKRNLTASCTYTVYTAYKALCPNGDTWKDKQLPAEARGKIRGR
jgi:hypothetical protein